MSAPNDGGPAFPAWELNGQGQPEMTCFGMTLRDHFAAKAMPGLLGVFWPSEYEAKEIAARAYQMADAMLKARAQ